MGTCVDMDSFAATHSTASLNVSTPPTSALNSSSNISHTSSVPKRSASSTSLIDLFSKDGYLSSFLRTNPRRDHNRLSPQVEESHNNLPDYAHDAQIMFRDRDNDKATRRSENRFYGFLRHSSRSRSKKRRSRSADAIPVTVAPTNGATTSHARHPSLENDENHPQTLAPSKPATISPSRPLSTATNGTITQNKVREKKNPQSLMPPPTGTEVLEKPRKKTIFGIPIPSSRRTSFSRSRPTTPKLPDPRKLERVFSAPHESTTSSTNLRSTDDIPIRMKHSMDISEPDSGLGHETVTKPMPPVTTRHEPSSGRSSPIIGFFMRDKDKGKDREREPSIRVASPVENGRESVSSRATVTPSISGPKMSKGRGGKHGTFDFERPKSSTVPSRGGYSRSGPNSRVTSTAGAVNGLGQWQASSTTYVIHEEKSPLTRSKSTRSTTHGQASPDAGAHIRFQEPPRSSPVTNGGTHGHRLPLPQQNGGTRATSPGSTNSVSPPRTGGAAGQSSSWGRSAGKRHALPTAGGLGVHPPFSFETSSAKSSDKFGVGRTTGKGRSLDLGIELNWAPTRVKEEAVMSLGKSRARWREEAEVKEMGRSKVTQSFEQVRGENQYSKFREYIHRFDARLIPLEGPSGLLYKVERLLDTNTRGLDQHAKRDLLDRLDLVIKQQHR